MDICELSTRLSVGEPVLTNRTDLDSVGLTNTYIHHRHRRFSIVFAFRVFVIHICDGLLFAYLLSLTIHQLILSLVKHPSLYQVCPRIIASCKI